VQELELDSEGLKLSGAWYTLTALTSHLRLQASSVLPNEGLH
jgi:hypothetical protein